MSHQNKNGNSTTGSRRTPNCECVVCGKPLYRRPGHLSRVRYVACMEHRVQAQKLSGITAAQRAGLALGRTKGDNHLKGNIHSAETKTKMAKARREWCAAHPDLVAAAGAKTRGEAHYNWKGGISRLNSSIRRMTENRKWMDAVKERDGECAKCGADTDLEAHHIKPLAELVVEHGITTRKQARRCAALWELTNGITLCERCHCEYHGRAYTPTGKGRRKTPRKVRRSMAGEANPNYRGGLAPLTCPQCGVVFHVKQAKASGRKYCSRGCANDSHRKNV